MAQFASAFSENDLLDQAIQEITAEVNQKLNREINLAFFFSSGYAPVECLETFPEIARSLGTRNVIGCNAETIAHDERELDGLKCITLLAGALPEAEIDGFSIEFKSSSEGSAFVGWPDKAWPDDATLLVLADPMSFPADVMLHRLNEDRPEVKVFGGMCSGAFANDSFVGDPRQQSRSVLALGESCFREGAVVIRLSGPTQIRGIVSQGCRPIGDPLVITDCHRNEIIGLGGKRAFDQLHDMFQSLPTRDQQLFQTNLHIGRVINEYKDKFEFGDFLIRNLTHIDKETGVVAAADDFRKGQTIQFHLRDEQAADVDLNQLLAAESKTLQHPQAALMFSCNGRGMNMFARPDHDTSLIRERLGAIPLSGFFAQGEIGPVAGENHVHGFTCVAAIFNQAD
jgi:small ligand-binding sensory domain FIST